MLSNRFEDAEPIGAQRYDQRRVDQMADSNVDLTPVGDGRRGVEIEPTTHRKRAEHIAIRRREQIEAPLDGRCDGSMPVDDITPTGAQPRARHVSTCRPDGAATSLGSAKQRSRCLAASHPATADNGPTSPPRRQPPRTRGPTTGLAARTTRTTRTTTVGRATPQPAAPATEQAGTPPRPVQGLPTRRQHPDIRRHTEEPAHTSRRVIHEVFTVVEQQQQTPIGKRIETAHTRPTNRRQHRSKHAARRDVDEVHHPDAVTEPAVAAKSNLDRQPRLPGAPCPRHRHNTVISQ